MEDAELSSKWKGKRMKLGNNKFGVSTILIATLIVGLALACIYSENTVPKITASAQTNQQFALTRPTFSPKATIMDSFLDQEAGIAVYVNTSKTINISGLPSSFINIENKTSSWAIGSVNLGSGFTSSDYPHCFIDVSGWIVVYYLTATSQNTAYVSKIIVWKSNSEGLTANTPLDQDKLMQGLNDICSPMGISTTSASYYDFQYPTATHMLIAVKTTVSISPATFNIEIPTTGVTVLEQSWSHRDGYYTTDGSYFKIDGVTYDLGYPTSTPPYVATYGELSLVPQNNPLTAGSFHTIYVDGRVGWCGICLTLLYN